MSEARPQARPFAYRTPTLKGDRGVTALVKSDILLGVVQTLKRGGEQVLHAHSGMDGFWFVLKGRARFYGEDDALIAEVGPHEGVFVPRGAIYRFQAAGEDMLELLQVEATDRRGPNKLTTYGGKSAPIPLEIFKPTGELMQEVMADPDYEAPVDE